MSNWEKFIKETWGTSWGSNNYIPRPVVDMIRMEKCYEFISKGIDFPVLVMSGLSYTSDDIFSTISLLGDKGITKIGISEASTACLSLIAFFMQYNHRDDAKYHVSIDDSYAITYTNNWGETDSISGVYLNISKKRV